MEAAEDAVADLTENESSPYSKIIDFQNLTDVDVSQSSSSKLSHDAETEVEDDFVQRNPLSDQDDDACGSNSPTLGEVDSPTIKPEAVAPLREHSSSSEEGSFAQIVSLPPAEREIVREEAKVDRTTAENGSGPIATTVQSQYNGRYVGSIRLPEGDLVGDKSIATMTECITIVAKGPKKTNKAFHEFKENQKVILKLEEREFKILTDEKKATVLLCHPFSKIRAWAVGKETDSRHFAYVIRSPDECAGYSYVCRVFKCGVKARVIATAFRHICQRRAAMRADKNALNA